MSDAIYTINKGINRPVVFQGLKGQYIGFTGAGLVLLLLVFAISYGLFGNAYLLLGCILPAGAGFLKWMVYLSQRFGEHGLRKWMAAKQMPLCVRSRTWKQFSLSGK